MNILSRLLAGIPISIYGLYLIYISFTEDLWIILYALPITAVGIFILCNSHEDQVEQLRTQTKPTTSNTPNATPQSTANTTPNTTPQSPTQTENQGPAQ
ncbi:hypothetical protein HOH51_03300 [bacterium]|nr:hypothetical protein [bacterium]